MSSISSIILKNPTSDTLSRFFLASGQGLNITLNGEDETAEMTVAFPDKKPIKFHKDTQDPKIAFVEKVVREKGGMEEVYVGLDGYDIVIDPEDKANYTLLETSYKTQMPQSTFVASRKTEERGKTEESGKTEGCISRLFSSIWNCVAKAFKALVDCICCRTKSENTKSDEEEEMMDLRPLDPSELTEYSPKTALMNTVKEGVLKNSLEQSPLR